MSIANAHSRCMASGKVEVPRGGPSAAAETREDEATDVGVPRPVPLGHWAAACGGFR
jgi:hypothetical protein